MKRSLAAMTLCGAAAAGTFFGANVLQSVKYARAAEEVEVTRQQLATVTDLSNVFKAVGKAVGPSVVEIKVRKGTPGGGRRGLPFDDEMLRRLFPDRDGDGEPDLPEGFGEGGGGGVQLGTGSGVIMEVNGSVGYILTNNHVAGGATEMDITLADGREISNGKIVGTDPKTDLAVIKIEADGLIPAKWGNSDTLERGDWVLAFGSPFGYVGSMTHGIISALNRDARIIDGGNGYENFIQVDAPINPGNSGGPLVNLQGEVIGINTAIASRSGGFQGIGFTIPVNQAKFVYKALKDSGKVTRGWLGVAIQDVAKVPEVAESFGYSSRDGILISKTYNDTPASGKLKEGDIITGIDGKPVKTVQQLRNLVAITPPGKDMSFTVYREGKSTDVTIKIGEQPDDPTLVAGGRGGRGPRGGGEAAGNGSAVESLGIRLGNVTPEHIRRYRLDESSAGAVITQVDPQSDAFEKGLRPGDVITKVQGTEVANADEARAALKDADLKKGVRIYITNAAGSRFAVIKSK